MKLPENIKGRHRIRDAGICNDWMSKTLTTEELAEKFKLTQRRIEQILKANHTFVVMDKEWEKKKRIHKRNLWIKKREKCGEVSKKDLDDLLESNRHEIEGDKPLIEINQYTQIWKEIAKKAKDVESDGKVYIRNQEKVPA